MRLAAAAALLAVVLVVPAAPRAQAPAGAAPEPAIRLVLLIAVDQFRYDYLTRFRSEYTAGLSQLLTRGATFTQAQLEHYPTVTAVGHATMLSGATPAISGIIGNDWYERSPGERVTSVSDPATALVGGTEGPGASPRRLLVSTLGDEMKNAAFHRPAAEQPRVIAVSLKDRSAILSAGHRADGAYWLDTRTGAFVTSTYYRADLPPWVAEFNTAQRAAAYAGRTWDYLDTTAGQGRVMPAAGPQLVGAVYGSPFGNELLRDLALAALEAEQLGRRGATDLLSVSFSSNDSVGHSHGPDSAQVRDMAVRTDRVIGEVLARVDALVGLDRTLVAFTTDHGVAPVPEEQQQRKLPGGRMRAEDLFGPIAAALADRYGPGDWILATAGSSPYLNHALIAEKALDAAQVRQVAAAAAAAVPHVARVYTREQLLQGQVAPDQIGARLARSYNLARSGDLEIVLDPYWLRSSNGTTHGTPYSYDAHIPLMLMGPGIRAGEYHGVVALNDLAPTLATLLGVATPSGSSGRALSEAMAPASRARTGGTR